MARHNDFGTLGEDIAADYLRRKGYVLLDRNWRSGHKEIDIVARQDDTLVFVEVKARTNVMYGNPEDAVTKRKMHLLVLAADAYLRCNALDCEVRFDVITITGTTQKPYIRHYEHAFRPGIGI
ncbi:MAG: YraN family protein [Bacteroides sp.]|nr:YraN family protein [Bacteroides sp.]MCM1446625.1 YraN family protein [Bacteroides sp.]MCM1516834.1 YraN family protein [Paraprevotella sp.]